MSLNASGSGKRNTSTTPPASDRAPATTAGYPLKTPSWTAKEPRRELRREEALHRPTARHLVLAKKMICSIFVARKSRHYFMVALSWECRKFYIHFVCSCRVCHQTDVHVRNTSLPTCLTPLPKTSQVSTHRMFQDPAMRKPLTCIARSLSRPRWCTKDREKQVRAFSANRTASTARFWRVHWHSSVVRAGVIYI